VTRPNIQLSPDRENYIRQDSHTTCYYGAVSFTAPTKSTQGKRPSPPATLCQIRTRVRLPKWRAPARILQHLHMDRSSKSTADGQPQSPQLDFRHRISDILFCKDL